MSVRTASPGAAILRSSRMFSLPAPLAPPPGDLSAATSFASNTATTAFPLRQAVTTPHRMRLRGDWGFKRAFPLGQTTRSSTPLLRVSEVDTIEHVTDYASASDHALNLEKWQELNMPMVMPGMEDRARKYNLSASSVFEESHDFTTSAEAKDPAKQTLRWKFKGPWLEGMSDGDFAEYIEKSIKHRRGEFKNLLRQRLAPIKTQDNKRRALEDGNTAETVVTVRPQDITDQDLAVYYRTLREDRLQLYELVSEFLDLAPIPVSEAAKQSIHSLRPDEVAILYPTSPYAKGGPPVTHPSAGLSYLRTNAYIENHPLYGPQMKHQPVKAKVITPKKADRVDLMPKLGVGGFVAALSSTDVPLILKNAPRELAEFNTQGQGASKIYVQPRIAKMSSGGRPQLLVEQAEIWSQLVTKESVGELSLFAEHESAMQQEKQAHEAAQSAEREQKLPKNMYPRRKTVPTPKYTVQGTYGI